MMQRLLPAMCGSNVGGKKKSDEEAKKEQRIGLTLTHASTLHLALFQKHVLNSDFCSALASEPYDPYIPNNQRGASTGGNQKTQNVQQQVDEVVGIMQENIDKVMQRGEGIQQLRGKTEDLQSTAGHFRRGANQVRKRMWWKDLKWKIIIAVTIIAILGIIIDAQQQQLRPMIESPLRLSFAGAIHSLGLGIVSSTYPFYSTLSLSPTNTRYYFPLM
ncbi:hypothetical protein [Absidia glauca]|uniref:V-SNARE coiled-coil homology domain-containing protein n=1 Tax=Absidia glauca TaxID=4829 RepID=A0A163IYY8_ABSGL|nr:hypothetical protein [Absidia glauca]